MTQEALQVIKVGDRVTRKPVNNFKHQSHEKGTVVLVLQSNRCKIKWDKINATGQRHSTIQTKFLNKITNH
jgi:hypothetical protein